MSKQWTKEEKDRATEQICVAGHDDGEAFFGRHPKLGFGLAVELQCELNEALELILHFEDSRAGRKHYPDFHAVTEWLERNKETK